MAGLGDDIQRYIDEHFPKGVSVPTGVSEDEAIRAVKEQFPGFDVSEETARGIVQEAWRSAAE
jgi:hypothetical protein